MNDQYNIKAWEEAASKNIFTWRYFIHRNTFPEWKLLEQSEPYQFDNGTITQFYFGNIKLTEHAVKIDVYEFGSWNDAQQFLLKKLNNHMNIKKLPEISGNKMLGDIAYKGTGKIEQHILLVRGNILLVINSIGDENISVRKIVAVIDDQLYLDPPTIGTPPSPKIVEFTVDNNTRYNKDVKEIFLRVSARDPTEGKVWFRFFSPDGEFLKRNDQVYYRPTSLSSRLFVYATNELGNTSVDSMDFGPGNDIGRIVSPVPEGVQ